MKKTISYLTLLFILLLIALSVYSAFIGAGRASVFFNSLPLAVYWAFGAALIVASVVAFRNLHKPHLFFIHCGTLLLILGSMLGSEKGHAVSNHLFQRQKPVKSQMVIYEDQSSHELYQVADNTIFALPFEVRLNEFIVEYYPSVVFVWFPDGALSEIPVQPGAEMVFSNQPVQKIQVVRVFDNFKLSFENDQRAAVDSPEPGRNPAVELAITRQDGHVHRQFVFELFPGHVPESGLQFTYHRPIKDYISRVDVIRDGIVVKSADLEVNHPLHFGGFHFYQYSYDSKQHQYTVLQVVSDDGLSIVYAGFMLLCVGTVWYFWFIRLRRTWK